MKPEWSYLDGKFHTSRVERFHNSDTEYLFNKNLKENYSLLEGNGWIPLPADERCVGDRFEYNPFDPNLNDWVELSYQINEHGFRGQEMPTEKKPRSIITIGCSTTFGVGMPVGQIWPTLVGNTIRQRAYNLGIPGGSLDSAFRVLMCWLPKIRPSHVFLLEPPGIRFETISNSFGYINSGANNIIPNAIRFEHEDEWILHKEKTMRAIKSLCEQFNTPFHYTHQDGDDDFFKIFDAHDLGRDLMHAGRKRHIFWAMKLLKQAGYEWDIDKK